MRQSKEPRACRAERLRLVLLDAEAMKLLAESSPAAGMSSRPGRIRQRSSEHLPKVAMARVSASCKRQAMPFAVSLPARWKWATVFDETTARTSLLYKRGRARICTDALAARVWGRSHPAQ